MTVLLTLFLQQDDFDRHARRAVPRDAFPVLDEPETEEAERAERWLRPEEPVIGIEIGGEARAYPLSIMGSHELVNDRLGGAPIAVSW